MRLIGTFETEKTAYTFYSFLIKEGIQNIYEAYSDEKSGGKLYRIWVYDEDDLNLAIDWMNQFKENPNNPRFQNLELPLSATPPPPDYAQVSESEELKWKPMQAVRIKQRRFSLSLMHLIILLCGFIFLWNDFQEAEILKEKGAVAMQIAFTPIMQSLLFDYPNSYRYVEEVIDQFPLNGYKEEKEIPPEVKNLLKKADEVPSWRGVYDFFTVVKNRGWESAKEIPLFEKIRQGELWRLFTPCILHRDFLHILFNMIWVWILVKQIEDRLSKWKLCLLILTIGVISNIAQYFMSGPFFLGFSGIVVGLAGFIWVRQKKAPWEGYPLQRATILFLLFFVIAMFALELFTFSLQLFSPLKITPSIANTAHIIGGLVGMLLGRISFFSRSVS